MPSAPTRSRDVIDAAVAALDPALREALEEAIRRVRSCTPTSGAQHDDEGDSNGLVTEQWVPVERVGLYVPGGVAVYPSSVIMTSSRRRSPRSVRSP